MMKLSKKITCLFITALMTFIPLVVLTANAENMYENSDFIETEQPELSDDAV